MTTLIIPGWLNSGPEHWQSLWERALPDCVRVEQADWQRPARDHWVACLDEAIRRCTEPPVLAAHSLGCITVAHWAAVGQHPVRAALLVAPPDVDTTDEPALHEFRPIPRARLPFSTLVVGSRSDPWMTYDRVRVLADAWGARFFDAGDARHINAEAGFGPWPEGLRLLEELARDATTGAAGQRWGRQAAAGHAPTTPRSHTATPFIQRVSGNREEPLGVWAPPGADGAAFGPPPAHRETAGTSDPTVGPHDDPAVRSRGRVRPPRP